MMDERPSSREERAGARLNVSLPKSALAMFLAALCAFLPVREAARCGQIRAKTAAVERQIKSRRDAMALLEAEIAQAGTPEFLFWLAGELGVELFRIDPQSGFRIQEGTDGDAL